MGLRLSAAGIFLLGAVGLLLHSTLLETGHIRPGMFCFYTNLSNLLVLVYELALAAVPEGAVRAAADRQRRGPGHDAVHLCDAPDLSLCAGAGR